MKIEKSSYFKKGDLIIYLIITTVFILLINIIFNLKSIKGTTAEIYVNNSLKYVFPLQKEQKNIFINTDIGGVNVEIKDFKIRVTSSNSPLKLNVKQGWIEKVGDVIIGIPDKMIIKIIGEKKENEDIDFIVS